MRKSTAPAHLSHTRAKMRHLHVSSDVTSAKSLALTSSSFYYTFLAGQSLILTQILQNEITTELLHGAFAAYQATQIPVWTKQAIHDFLNEYFGSFIFLEAQKWNLSETLYMSKAHSCVEFFAAEFVSSSLSKTPTARGSNAAPSNYRLDPYQAHSLPIRALLQSFPKAKL